AQWRPANTLRVPATVQWPRVNKRLVPPTEDARDQSPYRGFYVYEPRVSADNMLALRWPAENRIRRQEAVVASPRSRGDIITREKRHHTGEEATARWREPIVKL